MKMPIGFTREQLVSLYQLKCLSSLLSHKMLATLPAFVNIIVWWFAAVISFYLICACLPKRQPHHLPNIRLRWFEKNSCIFLLILASLLIYQNKRPGMFEKVCAGLLYPPRVTHSWQKNIYKWKLQFILFLAFYAWFLVCSSGYLSHLPEQADWYSWKSNFKAAITPTSSTYVTYIFLKV